MLCERFICGEEAISGALFCHASQKAELDMTRWRLKPIKARYPIIRPNIVRHGSTEKALCKTELIW